MEKVVLRCMLWFPPLVPGKDLLRAPRQRWGYGLPDQADREPQAPKRSAPGTRPWLQHIRGDVTGGVAAAVLSIPISMGYGLLALAPLGDAFVAQAILAGLYAPVLGCLVALLLGANTTMIYSPRSIITFLVGAFVLHSLANSDLPVVQSAPPSMLLALALLVMFLSGAFQALFGFMRAGALVKYIPAPVIAGFQNAAAILIFLSQVHLVLGVPKSVPLADLAQHLGAIQWPTLVVGAVTCGLMLRGARITRRIPPTILGLLGGLATYYVFKLIGLAPWLGPVVGAIPFALPEPRFFGEFSALLMTPEIWQIAPMLLAGALSLAIVASLDGMLCARLVQADSGQRIQDNRELVRLGVGNMVSAGFGGIPNGINLGSSFANHRSGARTPLSVFVHAMVVLFAIVAFSPLVSYLPRVVIAGLLLAIAIQLVDRWTIQILRTMLSRDFASARHMLTDLLVITLVTVAAVALNVVVAVVVGTTVTVFFFLFRMSRSVIRRAYRCDAVHSRKTREPKHMEILASHGSRIVVFELEGPLFFGTAENLAAAVEAALRENTSCVILDMKRVNDVDSTGAKILVQMHDRLVKDGRHLLVSSLEDHSHVAGFMKDIGVTAALTRGRIFRDSDRAMEWAEDHVILSELGHTDTTGEFPYAQLEVFAGMTEDELRTVTALLERRTYTPGEQVFAEGDESRELYITARGSASVRLRLAGDREARLVSFSAGTIFGELALLDSEARSASVQADEELVCYVLSDTRFDELTREHPAIAIKLLANLSRELSGRLRRATRTIYQLSS
jgi:MFS superfamily sulfate permease-like transporter